MRSISQHQRLHVVAIVAFAALALPTTAMAQQQPWSVHVQGTWSAPTGTFDFTSPEGQRIATASTRPFGASLTLEYRPDPRVGFEFGTMFARPTMNLASLENGVRVDAAGEFWFVPLTAGVNLHMTPEKAVDLYAGAMFLYAMYSDLEFVAPGLGTAFVQGHNDPGWGLQLGVDVPIGQRGWSFATSIKYLSTSYKVTDIDDGVDFDMKFNPFVLTFGVSARF